MSKHGFFMSNYCIEIMRKLYLLISLLILAYSTSATSISLENTSFALLSTEHGLSQKTASVIYQDKQGFIWIGTQEGLNRYDGNEIKVFRHLSSDKFSLSNNVIRDIQEDAYGRLWVATNQGLNLYNSVLENFSEVKIETPNGNFVNRINAIYLDKNKDLLIGTAQSGGYKLVDINGEFKFRDIEVANNLSNLDIRAFYRDSRGRLWIGTERKGVILISSNQFIQFTANENIRGSLSNNKVRDFLEDSDGNIWIATRGGGLNRFLELSQTFKPYLNDPTALNSLSHNRVYNIFQDSSSRIWVATDAGISIYQAKSDSFTQIKSKSSQKSGLSHNRVFSIIEDNGGSIWIGTLSGVNIWNPLLARFEHFRKVIEDTNTLASNTISALAEQESGRLLVGTFTGGLNYFDLSNNNAGILKNSEGETVSQKKVSSILVDKNKQIWTGSITKGIDIFTPSWKKVDTLQVQPSKINSLSSNAITDLIEDKNGFIWASTYGGGINKISKNREQFWHYKSSSSKGKNIIADRVLKLIEDSQGYIWAATDGGGISKIDPKTNLVENYLHDESIANSLSSNAAWTIFEDSKGRFWIGTQGHGLNRWEKEDRLAGRAKFKHYQLENGLPSSTVNGVLEDFSGNIWISTNKGVSRLNPENDEFENFNLASELHFNEFNLGVALRARSGQLFFGGLKGISTFKPENIAKNPHVPPVVLTKVISENKERYFNKPIYELEEITFSHNENYVAFEFAALDFAQPSKNRYQYQLEGLDSEWIQLGNLNRAVFTRLPSGTYTLKVKGSNNDGVWSDESINLKITVLPAPWFSWWALSVYGVTFCLVLLFIIRLQARRLAHQEMFKEQVNFEVEKKTALYSNNNEFLKQQLHKSKLTSLIDEASGLPNQRFVAMQMPSLLTYIESFLGDEPQGRMMISLYGVASCPHDLKDKLNSEFAPACSIFSSNASGFNTESSFAMWGESNLFSHRFVENSEEVKLVNQKTLEQLKGNIKIRDVDTLEWKTVSIMLPFVGVQLSKISGEDCLFLIEHLFNLIADLKDYSELILTGTTQDLTASKIKQILETTDFNEVKDILVIE